MPIDISSLDQYTPKKPKKAPKQAEPKTPLFPRFKTQAIADLEQSIIEATGFFVDKERVDADNPADVVRGSKVVSKTKKGFASPCWRFKSKKNYDDFLKTENDPEPIDADIAISIKFGGLKPNVFPDTGRMIKASYRIVYTDKVDAKGDKIPEYEADGKTKKKVLVNPERPAGMEEEISVNQDGVIPALKLILDDVKGWEKDSGDGKIAHDEAIARLKAMNAEKTMKDGTVKKGNTYNATEDYFE